ncbi:hypothetical protein [Roseateles sp.]|uniref:hypothetical protein n=1 Tax=Roseateles sp. TaxID=1971397 RepID=UPI002869F182|nr:hypothetical protein [Roseateles sp.]
MKIPQKTANMRKKIIGKNVHPRDAQTFTCFANARLRHIEESPSCKKASLVPTRQDLAGRTSLVK